MSEFELDPRLATDSVLVAEGPLSQVRLMNDERYPWLILVPRLAASPSGSTWTAISRTNCAPS